MLYGLDLFTGIGGLTLALSRWVRPMAYCESDPFCQAVLLTRMAQGHLPTAPIWDDISTLRLEQFGASTFDIIYGGFPCQDISVAGTGKGLDGKRSGLIFQLFRLVRDCRPRFVFLENVPAITVRGLDRILLDLAHMGYDARWTTVSAAEVGACHIRKRWFLLAHSNRIGLREKPKPEKRQHDKRKSKIQSYNESKAWNFTRSPAGKVTPTVDRTGDGIPYTLDRNRALGNSVHPQAAKKAFMKLIGYTNEL